MSDDVRGTHHDLHTFGEPAPNEKANCCDKPMVEVRFKRTPKYDTESGKSYTRVDAHCVNCDETFRPDQVGY